MEHESDNRQTDTDMVATLIQVAGRRPEPPEEAYHQVLGAATAVFRARTARRRERVWLIGAAAAGLVAVSVLLLLQRWPVAVEPRIAGVERTFGAVEREFNGRWKPLAESAEALTAGTRIRTLPGGGAALSLAGGASLRLAAATEVRLDAPRRMQLRSGRLYLDNRSSLGTGFRIETPVGTARDVGTQFELGVAASTLRLRVREGRVEIDRGGQTHAGMAGEQLDIDLLGGVTRSSIATTDPAWLWAEAMAPAPEIDGRPATELLAWVARETGHRLHYQSPAVEQRAATVILHGNIRHLAPLAALDAMLATTDLEYVLIGDTMEIRARPE